MEGQPKPRSIERIGEEFLAIVWEEDGHESFYEAPLLRSNCPCAECRVRRERMEPARKAPPGGLSLAMAPPRLVAIDEVGRYAVRIRWSDGHSAGLYEFRFLRDLCPCDTCTGKS